MELARREGDGAPLRTHLQRLAQSTGKVDTRLFNEIPRALEPLWQAYQRLAGARRSGMGLSPLTLTDIEAWCRLHGVTFTPWELDTLLDLDAAALSVAADNQRRQAPHSKPPPP